MSAIYTNTGQAFTIAQLDAATAVAAPDYFVGWGSDSTAPAVTQTALGTEHPEARDGATVTKQTTVSTDDTIRFVGTIEASASRVVNEAGVFTASTAGTMLLRGTHATLNIETGDRVEYTFDLRLKDVSE